MLFRSLEEGVDAGPLIHREACEGVERLVQQAVRAGAKVEVRHDTFSNKPELASGSFYPPTILSGIEDSMVLCGCEIFGPVFPVLVYDGLEELIERANSVEQGLAGYVYGNDLTMCRRVARELEVGIVGVNEWRPLKAEIPFGGIKQSGLGVEGGREGIHDYLRTHVVSLPRD